MPDERPRKPLEIGAARGRAASAWIAWALVVGLVAAGVVLVFVRFTGSAVLAVALVAMMLIYMLVMCWLAIRNIEGKR